MKTFLKLISSIVVVCAVVLLVPKGAMAQGYGSIGGTVTDATGAVVPGAVVTATQSSTGLMLKTTSSGEGTYIFPSLAPSIYSVSASHAGFETFAVKDLQLRADAALTTNIILRAGSATETVTVSAEAAQVDVTTGTLAQVIGTAQVNELPLNGRNLAALTAEVAGVTVAPSAQADQGATKTFPVAFTISANGTRVGQTNYLLDGANNVDEYTNVNAPFPMPDAVQEFSVQTSNYNAEYGQNAGGVVNIITKSGSSQYHGNLFEFVRNRAFNAANFFAYVNGVKTVDPLKRNQFGGTIGGPVEIPGLLHANHSFFFFGYQKTINHTAATSASAQILPTPAQLAGNFNFTTSATPGTTAFNQACISNPALASTQYLSTQCYPYVSNGGNSYTASIPSGTYRSEEQTSELQSPC